MSGSALTSRYRALGSRPVISLKPIIFAAAAFWAGASLPGYAEEQYFITIGTGGVTGVYYPSGGATCKILNESRSEHGVRCSVETTLGSISNIDQIRSGELDFGYVQSDWQHHAFHGTSVFQDEGAFDDLRTVFSLHSEAATIVVRADSEFQSFDDLKAARVNIGSDGSGSAASWKVLVDKVGWTETDRQNETALGSSALAEALCTGQIDAFFVLIGHPAALIDETQDQCPIRLIGIENSAVDMLVQDTPFYIEAVIPAELYGLPEQIDTFGAVATFVTSAKMPDKIVSTLVGSVLDNFDSFRDLHPALGRLEPEDLVAPETSVPLHPGALKFFHEQGLLPANSSK
ncbi:MAG: TAXI family TRAP transporter solute-binding subunit [Roseibium sp.]|nr:TAXI family TRAP transporter solute-binding subunit [Roseibium sp.]